MEYYQIPDNEWWRMNKKKNEVSTIKWTPKCGGWVKGRIDDDALWRYKPCFKAEYAEILGRRIISLAKKEIEANKNKLTIYETHKHEIEYYGYQGA